MDSSCSNAMVVDTTAPVIVISSPGVGSWVNLANDSTAFQVMGSCSEAGRTVTIKSDGTIVGTATCTGVLFSGTINSTVLTQASHSLAATISDAAGNSTTSTAVSITRDVMVPSAATSVSWANSSPANSLSVNATWVKSSSSDLGSQKIQFYNGSGCNAGSEKGGLVSLLNTQQSQNLIGVDGEGYSYQLISIDHAGNTSSACSSLIAVDVTPPAIPATLGWSQSSPFNANSVTAAWVKSVSTDLSTQKIQFFASSSCAVGTEAGSLISLSNSVQTQSFSGTNAVTYSYRITSTDTASNTSVSACSSSMLIDTVAPVMTASSMLLNGGAASTGNNYLNLSLQATDLTSNVSKFCLNYVSNVAPSASSNCWISVNAPSPGLTLSKNLNLVDFNYAVGFLPSSYTVYAWVMDAAGNISSLTNSGTGTVATDKATITIIPGTAPVITDIFATNTDAPSSPPSASQLTIGAGSSVIIKWKIQDDSLPSTPVTLSYTTDDSIFTEFANNLSNGVNGTCSINNAATTADDNDTGCYAWTNGSPTAGYFRIRVSVKDSDNITSFSSSQAINTSGIFKFVAGNTDSGLGSSAKSAVFYPSQSQSYYADAGSLVVAKNGVIYHRDLTRGIIMVSPGDGNRQTLLIRTTGTMTDGSISSATLKEPLKIALDYQDRILIWDYNKIRRINTQLNPMTVETIIGGGSQSSDNTLPLNYQLIYPGNINSNGSKMPWLVPVPNGDLYFTNNAWQSNPSAGASGGKISRYDSVNNVIRNIVPSGIGINGYLTQNIADCYFSVGGVRFNPANSVIDRFMILIQDSNSSATSACDLSGLATLDPSGVSMSTRIPNAPTEAGYNYRVSARNGEVYTMNRWTGRAWKYNNTINDWTPVLGAGAGVGSCADGTDALLCKIDINDLFVDEQENIYFMDRGVIRIVDKVSNQVRTILGQNLSYGDGGNALSARFNLINNFDRATSGELVVLDVNEYKFRSISPSGIVSTIAGTGLNGGQNTSSLATTQPIQVLNGWGANFDDFVINPASGDVFYARFGNIAKLDRITGKWVDLMGGGSTYYSQADNLIGSLIVGSSREAPKVIGFDGNNILAAIGGYTSETTLNMHYGYLKKYAITNGLQTHLAADLNSVTPTYNFCSDGTLTANCVVPQATGSPRYNRSTYDTFTSPARWAVMKPGTNALRGMEEGTGGLVSTITTFNDNASSFAYVHTASSHVAYYCSTVDYKIHKKNIVTGIDSVLDWPISTMKCNGRSMVYYENSPSDRRLLFPYLQNSLAGVAEYLNP